MRAWGRAAALGNKEPGPENHTRDTWLSGSHIMRTVIVGGGIAGVALSKFLAQRGVAVTLLERSAQLCSGATWHAAGTASRHLLSQ